MEKKFDISPSPNLWNSEEKNNRMKHAYNNGKYLFNKRKLRKGPVWSSWATFYWATVELL